MLNNYQHVSFDLDGTLVHTAPEYRYKIVSKVVEELGGIIRGRHLIDKFWFESGRDEIIQSDFNLNPEKFWRLYHATESPEERALYTRAYEDAEPALRNLKKIGKTVSIITGAPEWIATMEIKKLNGAPYDFFSSVHRENFGSKPDPASFLYVLRKLSIKPDDTLYIGNSNEDAYYAKNAGVGFVYLERKEHKFNLKDYAFATINSLDELFN